MTARISTIQRLLATIVAGAAIVLSPCFVQAAAQRTAPIDGMEKLHVWSAYARYRDITEAKLREAVAEVVALSDQQLIEQVTADVAARKSLYDRSKYEQVCEDLAHLFKMTGDAALARKSALVLSVLAADAARLPSPELGRIPFHDWGKVVPAHCVVAYNLLQGTRAWDDVPTLVPNAPDPRAAAEAWFRRGAWHIVQSGQVQTLTNITPFGLRHAAGVAVVCNDPQLVRGVVQVVDLLMSGMYFNADGMWYEGAISYHDQTVNNTVLAIELLRDTWQDPAGYDDTILGLKLDKTDLTGRWALIAKARTVQGATVYPDGRRIPIGDTYGLKPVAPPYAAERLKNVELWHYGLFALTHGTPSDATQLSFHLPALAQGFTGGHRHVDSLNITLFGAGGDLLPDAGYAFKPANNRYFYMSPKAHNVPWVWSKDHNYKDKALNGQWNRPALLAYDDGARNGKQVQVIEGSSLGPPAFGVDMRRRLVLLIAGGESRSYTFDLSRLQGGDVHEWYLRASDNEDTELATSAQLTQQQGTLEEYLASTGKADGDALYRNVMREPRVGSGEESFDFSWTGKETGSVLRAWVNGVDTSEIFFTRIPRLRPTEQDEKKKDAFPGWHLSRRLILPQGGGAADTDFGAATLKENSAAALRDAGWKLNPAANRDDAVFVTRGTLSDLQNYLTIADTVTDGAPQATLPFPKLGRGELELRVATDGPQNHHAAISLMSGEKVLATVKLMGNATGTLLSADGEKEFTDPTGWFRRGRTLRFAWNVGANGRDGNLAIAFDGLGGGGAATTRFADLTFAADGVPDAVRFDVGYGSANDRKLLLDAVRVANLDRKAVTSFAGVYDTARKGQPALVQQVQWLAPQPAAEGVAAALVTLANGEQDLVYASNDTIPRTIKTDAGAVEVAGPMAVLRRTPGGQVAWGYLLGEGSAKAGTFAIEGTTSIESPVVGVTRRADGQPVDSLLLATDRALPDTASVTGRWASIVFGDGSARGMRIQQDLGPSRQLIVHDDPGFRIDGDGASQLYFPHAGGPGLHTAGNPTDDSIPGPVNVIVHQPTFKPNP